MGTVICRKCFLKIGKGKRVEMKKLGALYAHQKPADRFTGSSTRERKVPIYKDQWQCPNCGLIEFEDRKDHKKRIPDST